MVKTITSREDVYRRLLAVKREGESFSKLLERFIEEVNLIDVRVRLKGCI
ncbi:MAG: antitoxin VapB family protein [Thermoproteota archaeon]